jgi:hypothetical protein
MSLDPIRGVGQKSETFWTHAHEEFCLLQKKQLAVVGLSIIVQTGDSIEQRWKKESVEVCSFGTSTTGY